MLIIAILCLLLWDHAYYHDTMLIIAGPCLYSDTMLIIAILCLLTPYWGGRDGQVSGAPWLANNLFGDLSQKQGGRHLRDNS